MKLDEQLLLELRLELEELISEREGMIAENKQREHRGESIAFDGERFFLNQNAIKSIRDRLIWLGEKG